jgi:hypothetical protein
VLSVPVTAWMYPVDSVGRVNCRLCRSDLPPAIWNVVWYSSDDYFTVTSTGHTLAFLLGSVTVMLTCVVVFTARTVPGAGVCTLDATPQKSSETVCTKKLGRRTGVSICSSVMSLGQVRSGGTVSATHVWMVGDFVGGFVGRFVGADVGAAVGSCVGSPRHHPGCIKMHTRTTKAFKPVFATIVFRLVVNRQSELAFGES